MLATRPMVTPTDTEMRAAAPTTVATDHCLDSEYIVIGKRPNTKKKDPERRKEKGERVRGGERVGGGGP